ncbi:hypothetical protein [Nocardiopsis sp. NRRL B-16309]|uniref:hypothetical protein n=1 Tax=Nocardiopsis sp. NRRL B-16309 TaxID=1519494 RepID=UPI0006AF03B5|nr:hypothetical protein [Nocardiopsis sp. NRRL B-16309]KOX13360.1 hypothetical protein ADL05_19100 [Nocardiopsis sp. NRRL B-16309]
MRSRVSTAPRGAVAAGCLIALLLPTGCASAAEEAADAPDPSPTASAADDEAAVLTAYTGMWEAVVTASHEGTGASAELERHAVDGALVLMTQALEDARRTGSDVSGEPALDPEVLIESTDRAQVTDCLDDSSWRLSAQAASAEPRRVDAVLVHDGLAWRVSDLRIWEPGTC